VHKIDLLINGLLPVSKPMNYTSSHTALQIKGILGNKSKVGHGGTLDPFATGVLVIGAGYSCTYLSTFLQCSKSYVVTGKLGIETDTLDRTGKQIYEKQYHHITKQHMIDVLPKFTGKIQQTPPLYSALKLKGKPLYTYARQGIDINIQSRETQVFSLSLLEFNPPIFTLDLNCRGGFYVRSLIRDIGVELNSCATTEELVRTRVGVFTQEMALPIEEWEYSKLKSELQKGLRIFLDSQKMLDTIK